MDRMKKTQNGTKVQINLHIRKSGKVHKRDSGALGCACVILHMSLAHCVGTIPLAQWITDSTWASHEHTHTFGCQGCSRRVLPTDGNDSFSPWTIFWSKQHKHKHTLKPLTLNKEKTLIHTKYALRTSCWPACLCVKKVSFFLFCFFLQVSLCVIW